MYKYLIISLFINICFPNFSIGVDFSSEASVQNSTNHDLDIGLSLAYDNEIGSKFGYGFEYLLPTEFEDYYAKVSMISLYGKYAFVKYDHMIIYGKIGFSDPKLDYYFDSDIDIGLMYGIQLVFGPMNISFSNHTSNMKIYLYDTPSESDIEINRIKASYSF